MSSFLRKASKVRPFTLLGLATIAVMIASGYAELEYDDGGWGTASFLWVITLGAWFRWLFMRLDDLDIVLGVTWSGNTVLVLTVLLGLAPYVALDFALSRYVGREDKAALREA